MTEPTPETTAPAPLTFEAARKAAIWADQPERCIVCGTTEVTYLGLLLIRLNDQLAAVAWCDAVACAGDMASVVESNAAIVKKATR